MNRLILFAALGSLALALAVTPAKAAHSRLFPPLNANRDWVISKLGPPEYADTSDQTVQNIELFAATKTVSIHVNLDTYPRADYNLILLYENNSLVSRTIVLHQGSLWSIDWMTIRMRLQQDLGKDYLDIEHTFDQLDPGPIVSVFYNQAASWGIYAEDFGNTPTEADPQGTEFTGGVCNDDAPALGLTAGTGTVAPKAWRREHYPTFYIEGNGDYFTVDLSSLCDPTTRPRPALLKDDPMKVVDTSKQQPSGSQ